MQNWRGPVFIAGMPRSGTKLLRDLLNQHSQIGIPEVETHFIPLLIKKYGEDLNFNNESKKQLINDFLKTSFYWNMKNKGFAVSEKFYNRLKNVTNWQNFVFLILSNFGPKQENDNLLYGDKTPGYINHLPLLKSICSNAKFIHIVRDPRDFCLSVKNIWNKHLLRAAYTWNNTLKKTTYFKEKYQQDYIEIKYEDLISDVEKTMKKLSEFLDINFEPAMCMLSRSAENYGDAKGKTEVLKNNKNKFVNKLSKSQVQKIEALAFSQMNRLGYKPMYAVKNKKPGRFILSYWKFYDAFNSAKFHVKEKGIANGLMYFKKLHNQSSWR